MAKNIHFKKEVDCYKSLNRIMILGLSGMTVLGTSLLISEGNKSEASMLPRGMNSTSKFLGYGAKVILKSPAFKPNKIYTPTISLLNKTGLINKNTPVSHGSLLSSIQRSQLNKPRSLLSSLKPISPTKHTVVLSSKSSSNSKGSLVKKNNLTSKNNLTPVSTPTLIKKK